MNALLVPVDIRIFRSSSSRLTTWSKDGEILDPASMAASSGNSSYIHIALPDALCNAEVNDKQTRNDNLSYIAPPLPDHLLMMRIFRRSPRGGEPQVDNGKCKAWILAPQNKAPLDVLTRGIDWTCSYEGAEGYFAMCDDLSDCAEETEASITYLAMGWWDSRANDPLSESNANAYKDVWSVKTSDSGFVFPGKDTFTLLHGAVYGVPVVPSTAAPEGVGDDIDVGIGWNLESALAALLSRGDMRMRPDAIEAFLRNRLSELSDPEGVPRLAEERHSRSFHGEMPLSKSVAVTGSDPGARYYFPTDLSIVIQNAGRSQRHGGDGRFSESGAVLECELLVDGVDETPLREVLERIEDKSAPDEESRHEKFIFENLPGETQKAMFSVIQEATTLGQTPDKNPITNHKWSPPWIPLWLDFDLAIEPSYDSDLKLAEYDYDTARDARRKKTPPFAQNPRAFSGRTCLSSAPARALSLSFAVWQSYEKDFQFDNTVYTKLKETIAKIGAIASKADILSGSLAGIRNWLLGLENTVVKEGESHRGTDEVGETKFHQLKVRKGGIHPFSANRISILGIKIIDCFGQYREIKNLQRVFVSDELQTTQALPLDLHAILVSPQTDPRKLVRAIVQRQTWDPAIAPGGVRKRGHGGTLLMPPRFFCSSRLLFRFIENATSLSDLVSLDESSTTIKPGGSPVAGFLMWDGIEGATEFFSPSGKLLWQIGGKRSDSTVDSDIERFLSALQQIFYKESENVNIDRPLWTVDPKPGSSFIDRAILLSRPLILVKAAIRLELDPGNEARGPGRMSAKDLQILSSAIANPTGIQLPLRIGDLRRSADGLVFYSASGGRPETAGSFLTIKPYETVPLLLLMSAGREVSITSGFTPRKSIALKNEWFEPGLQGVKPSFKIGPIMVTRTAGDEKWKAPALNGYGDDTEIIYPSGDSPDTKLSFYRTALVRYPRGYASKKSSGSGTSR